MVLKHITVRWKGKTISGLLINHKDGVIEIKLSNGYNIGLNEKEVEIIEERPYERRPIEKQEDETGEVVLISCGGTISSKVDYETGGVSPQVSAKELIQQFPELEDIATLEGRILLNLLSENMTQSEWEAMVDAIDEEFRKNKKVVLLHGTDTMHYSASAVAFAFRGMPSPVVFTGAQRSVDRPSSDAKLNLMNAVFTSKQAFGESVIVMHSSMSDDVGVVIRGVRARKMHTSRRDAFQSINAKPLGYVDALNKTVELSNPEPCAEEWHVENGFERNVAMLYLYPGMDVDVIKYFLKYKGVVLVGTGLGHAPLGRLGFYEAFKELCDNSVVVMCSQTIHGRINMNVYSTGRELLDLGVVGNLLDATPETMYVKLSWVLRKTKSKEKAKELLHKNVAHEFSERSFPL